MVYNWLAKQNGKALFEKDLQTVMVLSGMICDLGELMLMTVAWRHFHLETGVMSSRSMKIDKQL